MLKKSLSLGLILLLVQMMSAGPIYAQSDPAKEDALSSKVKRSAEKLSANGKKIARVKLHNGTKLKGYVSEADDDSFVVTDKHGQKNTVAYTDVRELKKGSGLSRTSKILIVSGIVVAVLVTIVAVSIARGLGDFNLSGIGL